MFDGGWEVAQDAAKADTIATKLKPWRHRCSPNVSQNFGATANLIKN